MIDMRFSADDIGRACMEISLNDWDLLNEMREAADEWNADYDILDSIRGLMCRISGVDLYMQDDYLLLSNFSDFSLDDLCDVQRSLERAVDAIEAINKDRLYEYIMGLSNIKVCPKPKNQ